MSPGELCALLLLCLLAWLCFSLLKVREAGLAAARAACQREGVQLLDETVAGRSLRLARSDTGRIVWRCVYDFDYSCSGADRFRGSLMLLGEEVTMLDLSAHKGLRLVH